MVGMLLTAAPEASSAPQNGPDPAATVNRLRGLFDNCAFSGTQTKVTHKPAGGNYSNEWSVVAKACDETAVIHYQQKMKNHLNSNGEPIPDRTKYGELRWVRNESRMDTLLLIRPPHNWPQQPVAAGAIATDNVVVHPKRPNDRKLVWAELLISNIVGDMDGAGVTLADVVAGGPFGYQLEKTDWAADRTQVTYTFVSPDYGPSVLTFAHFGAGGWMPTVIRLTRSRDHMVAPATLLGPENRVRNFKTFKDFTEPNVSLDGLETLFEFAYAPGPGGTPLPTSLKKTETRLFKAERSLLTTTFTFDNFRAGGVTADEVRAATNAIPNGTQAYLPGHPEFAGVEMMWSDGQPVKRIDAEAVGVSRLLTFSSRTRLALMGLVGFLALAVGFVLYRRRRSLVKEVQ